MLREEWASAQGKKVDRRHCVQAIEAQPIFGQTRPSRGKAGRRAEQSDDMTGEHRSASESAQSRTRSSRSPVEQRIGSRADPSAWPMPHSLFSPACAAAGPAFPGGATISRLRSMIPPQRITLRWRVRKVDGSAARRSRFRGRDEIGALPRPGRTGESDRVSQAGSGRHRTPERLQSPPTRFANSATGP